jgi:deoxyribodipyrimidine photo-lyase
LASGELPEVDALAGDLGPVPPGPALLHFEGGEEAGVRRLHDWVDRADALRTYKETRNGLLRADDSSKLSPWLARGCVSPRRVVDTVRDYEAARGANASTYWLVFELLWRDYFAFLGLREGPRLFAKRGIGRRERPFSADRARFDAWRLGRTGVPFVDAFMRELRATGFMSNRGRQNVASFLAKTLGVDWRWGAAWFEACLVDYDPASNWGNWQYNAGVGTDPRDRTFNVVKQAFDYDVNADFVRRWVPEVCALPGGRAHVPWDAGGVEGYPDPVLPPGRFGAPR